MGYLAIIVPVIIFPYYCVIGGWVIKYAVTFMSGQAALAAGDSYFGDFIGDPISPLVFFLIFIALTALVIILGVQKGIEKISKVLMPVLLVLTIGISIYVLTIDGAMEGLKYYLLPDFSKFSIKTICAAMGQLFYSMSLAMGIMITYGSYSKDDVNLNKSVTQIEVFDTIIALLAGLMVIPAVFVFSGEAGLKSGGAGLMFITLPKVFDQMPGGTVIGILFFILVFFAAITSSISLMEAIVSMITDKFKIKRLPAILIVFGVAVLLGIPSSLGNGIWSNIKLLGMDFLTFFDFISNSILMPIVAFCTCLLIGWIVGTKTVTSEITKNGEKFARERLYNVMIKYVSPVCMLVIIVFYTLAQFGVINF